MSRPVGRRNEDFDEARARLARAALRRLLAPQGSGASFRELAAACGVSAATLRHYFGSRTGLVAAAWRESHQSGARYLAEVLATPTEGARASLRWLLHRIDEGLAGPLSALHAAGLANGATDAALGPAYITEVLEPTLQAAEARLAHHVARGELRRCDLRHAALMLLGPVLLARLHQGPLGGAACRPLAITPLLDTHLDAFLRAFAAA